ncbi:hypothetical protein CIHG_09406 [Coccidioides immitis H538.4]|uniref:Uncharacterized protein n=1 Tax=Coccidioides immitis H538.4 TaxID=396776 RepID=A0A0J8S4C6_COCIT|nr:hypothetical protein CIHG_09406 [Coccidioides immitis H538.4]
MALETQWNRPAQVLGHEEMVGAGRIAPNSLSLVTGGTREEYVEADSQGLTDSDSCQGLASVASFGPGCSLKNENNAALVRFQTRSIHVPPLLGMGRMAPPVKYRLDSLMKAEIYLKTLCGDPRTSILIRVLALYQGPSSP